MRNKGYSLCGLCFHASLCYCFCRLVESGSSKYSFTIWEKAAKILFPFFLPFFLSCYISVIFIWARTKCHFFNPRKIKLEKKKKRKKGGWINREGGGGINQAWAYKAFFLKNRVFKEEQRWKEKKKFLNERGEECHESERS